MRKNKSRTIQPRKASAVCVTKTPEARKRLKEQGRLYFTVNGYYIIHLYEQETTIDRTELLRKLGLTVAQRPLKRARA